MQYQWAVTWATVGEPDVVESRHRTLAAAAREARRCNHKRHFNLLCAYMVVGLNSDGTTRPLDDDEYWEARDAS